MTNGDKIREMVNSEIAEIILCPYDVEPQHCMKKCGCFECCQEWLEMEVEK